MVLINSKKILAWNIQHGGGRRILKLLNSIENHDSDIVVLSEFRLGSGGEKVIHGLARIGLPHHVALDIPKNFNGALIASKDASRGSRITLYF